MCTYLHIFCIIQNYAKLLQAEKTETQEWWRDMWKSMDEQMHKPLKNLVCYLQ